MTAEPGRPTLTDAAGSGGINALDGFDYQIWEAIVRIPGWLKRQSFEGVLFEGLEDFEARFFAPHAPHGHLLDRFQAKSGTLQKNDLRDVFASFARFANANPDVSRVQTLVTPALPARLEWLGHDPERVRRARPFYHPFPGVNQASDTKLRDDLSDAFGSELGDFIADNIAIDLRPITKRAIVRATFADALHNAGLGLDLVPGQWASAFDALVQLIGESRGTMLSRARVFDVLARATGQEFPVDNTLLLTIRSDNAMAESDALEIDASAFSGTHAVYPDQGQWEVGLLKPLAVTAGWARSQDRSRVQFSGSYRISTAFSLGWSFRAASGFELEIPTREAVWSTDDRPLPGDAMLPWEIRMPSRRESRLAVAIGVLRDPTPDVVRALGVTAEGVLAAFLPVAVKNAREAQSSVEALKGKVLAALHTTGATGLDVFFAGPAALAVALGHRWNALPPTQLYEFMPSERHYIPTALLLDRA